MSAPSERDAAAALAAFAAPGRLVELKAHTIGLINHAWVASLDVDGRPRRYLLQQINRHVFQRPGDVLDNMQRITRHLEARLARETGDDLPRTLLGLVETRDGAAGHRDERGETWRLLPWLEGARFLERATSESEAREAARAFGLYLRWLSDLPAPALRETIPGFHDTPARLAALERAAQDDASGRAAGCRGELQALLDRGTLAKALAPPAARGALPVRPVHNDAKVANVLFEAASDRALAVVDLDTTMPGLAAHDFGDLVRTAVSDSVEDERDLARVRVRPGVFAALASGFVAGAGDALSRAERESLLVGAHVIVYEQAARFLADHLGGDRYYRISRPGHNLDRARTQLALLAGLEGAAPELARAVGEA